MYRRSAISAQIGGSVESKPYGYTVDEYSSKLCASRIWTKPNLDEDECCDGYLFSALTAWPII